MIPTEDVACPACPAQPGEPCRGRPIAHRERVTQALRESDALEKLIAAEAAAEEATEAARLAAEAEAATVSARALATVDRSLAAWQQKPHERFLHLEAQERAALLDDMHALGEEAKRTADEIARVLDGLRQLPDLGDVADRLEIALGVARPAAPNRERHLRLVANT